MRLSYFNVCALCLCFPSLSETVIVELRVSSVFVVFSLSLEVSYAILL